MCAYIMFLESQNKQCLLNEAETGKLLQRSESHFCSHTIWKEKLEHVISGKICDKKTLTGLTWHGKVPAHNLIYGVADCEV